MDILPISFIIAGIIIIFIPPAKLLKWDATIGFWIYKRTLNATGEEEKAVRTVGIYYKIFGVLFAMSGLYFYLSAKP